ncbi:MAG: hypothetical protein LBB43_04685, partial [Spirochaetaceae bacterium]|nr:hypothetical protein [Spirochaetaceae bacterium]
ATLHSHAKPPPQPAPAETGRHELACSFQAESRASIPDTTIFETRWRAKSRTPFRIPRPER